MYCTGENVIPMTTSINNSHACGFVDWYVSRATINKTQCSGCHAASDIPKIWFMKCYVN